MIIFAINIYLISIIEFNLNIIITSSNIIINLKLRELIYYNYNKKDYY